MIEFKFSCPSCSQHIQANDAYSGRQINCPTCQSILVVPPAPGAPPPIPASATQTAPPPAPPTQSARPQAGHVSQRPMAAPKKSNLKWILIASGGAVALIAAIAVVMLVGFSHSENIAASTPDKAASTHRDSAVGKSANLSGPSAAEIVQKITDKYAGLKSYSAAGTAVTKLDMSKVDLSKMPGMDKVPKGAKDSKSMKQQMSKPITTESEFTVKLGRPDLYLVQWDTSANGVSMKGAVWSAGEGDFISIAKNKYTKMDSRDLAIGMATGASGGVAATVPAVFFKDASSTLNILAQPERIADATVDGDDCYVLSGDTMGVQVMIWVIKDTFLIKQKQVVFGGKTKALDVTDAQMDEGMKNMKNMTADEKKQAKAMAKSMKPMLAQMKGSMTETYRDIEIDKSLTKKDFAYALPPEAKLSKTLY